MFATFFCKTRREGRGGGCWRPPLLLLFFCPSLPAQPGKGGGLARGPPPPPPPCNWGGCENPIFLLLFGELLHCAFVGFPWIRGPMVRGWEGKGGWDTWLGRMGTCPPLQIQSLAHPSILFFLPFSFFLTSILTTSSHPSPCLARQGVEPLGARAVYLSLGEEGEGGFSRPCWG